MRFRFLNAEATAKALFETSDSFRDKISDEAAATHFVKERAVELFVRKHSNATSGIDINEGVLEVPIWKNVGVVFLGHVSEGVAPTEEEWPADVKLGSDHLVDVNFFTAL